MSASVAYRYHLWYSSAPFDLGQTTRNAVSTKVQLHAPETVRRMYKRVRRLNSRSLSNGGLMRLAPLPIWCARAYAEAQDDPDRDRGVRAVARLACLEQALTHSHPTAQIAGAVLAVASAHLIATASAEGFRPEGIARRSSEAIDAARRCLAFFAASARGRDGAATVSGWLDAALDTASPLSAKPHIGFAKHGFVAAFRFVCTAPEFRAALRQILALGGDTDTNAAISLSPLGALLGLTAIPPEYVDTVRRCQPIVRTGINFSSSTAFPLTEKLVECAPSLAQLEKITEVAEDLREFVPWE